MSFCFYILNTVPAIVIYFKYKIVWAWTRVKTLIVWKAPWKHNMTLKTSLIDPWQALTNNHNIFGGLVNVEFIYVPSRYIDFPFLQFSPLNWANMETLLGQEGSLKVIFYQINNWYKLRVVSAVKSYDVLPTNPIIPVIAVTVTKLICFQIVDLMPRGYNGEIFRNFPPG